MNLRYNTIPVDERYDMVKDIGYVNNYEFEVTSEPFNLKTAMYWRYDKNIQAWVEGEIDEESGEWRPLNS
jgi:hypothetical protein